MNNIRAITFKILRTYATKAELAGVRKKAYLLKNKEVDLEEINQEDMGVYETDFRDITNTYMDYKINRLKEKEKLRQRIVKSRVFKTTEPRFLTYIEKDLIKKMHESDPEEWTPEKLSESFPALPDTIRKVLRSNWTPKSMEAIVNYDQKAIENWENFKKGQLPLSPALTEHLMKFKHRKIHLNETLLEKFVAPKLEFTKPKSSFFRSIMHGSTNAEETTKSQLNSKNINQSDKDQCKMIKEDSVDVSDEETYFKHMDRGTSNVKKYNSKEQALSFDEFLKQKINNLNEMSPEERETLVETYKKHTESINLSPKTLNDNAKDVTIKRRSSKTIKRNSSDTNELAIKETNTESKILTEASATCSSLDTFVKEHISRIETDYNYVKKIRIPKNVYKPGMTYRVNDCYYDDDGEFLYRVPSLY